jgi:putative intracellular protease/amidase
MEMIRILIVATSHDRLGDSGRKTGAWLEELAIPFYIFKEAGALITLASPKGGEVPLDPKSESIIVSTSTMRRFQKDPEAIALLEHSLPLSTQRAQDFDLVYLAGGPGPAWDFAWNGVLKELLEDFDRQHKLIGAVSHGAAGLLALKNALGDPLVKGRRLTAFSHSEEKAFGLTAIMPLMLESALTGLGALYSQGPDFEKYIVIDGNIITGQNAASAREVARQLLAGLKELSKGSFVGPVAQST